MPKYRIPTKSMPFASYPGCQKAVAASLIDALQWHKAGGVWLGPYNSASVLGGSVYFDTRRDATILQTALWHRILNVCMAVEPIQRNYVEHSYEPIKLLKTYETDMAMRMASKQIAVAHALGCTYNPADHRPPPTDILANAFYTDFFTNEFDTIRRADEQQHALINVLGRLDNDTYEDIAVHGAYVGNFGPLGRTAAYHHRFAKSGSARVWTRVATTDS